MLAFDKLHRIQRLTIRQKDILQRVPRHIGLVPSLTLKLVELECESMPIEVVEHLLQELCELKSPEVKMHIRTQAVTKAPVAAMGHI